MEPKNQQTRALSALVRAISKMKTERELKALLVDLCTPAELSAMAGRWQAAQLIAAKKPYRDIAETTGLSTTTVTRVARCVTYGTGGYRTALGRRS